MLAAQPAAVVLRDEAAVGDAEQRVVRLVHVGVAEMHVVGRHERQVFGIGEIDQPVFGGALLRQAMALQFDIKPVAEKRLRRSSSAAAASGWPSTIRRLSGPPGPPVSAMSPSA